MNARGIPPAMWQVLPMLSYLGWPPPPPAGLTYPPADWPPLPPAGLTPLLAGLTPPPAGLTPPGWTDPPPRLDWPSPPPSWTDLPLWTDRWKDRHVSKHYLPVVLRTRAVKMPDLSITEKHESSSSAKQKRWNLKIMCDSKVRYKLQSCSADSSWIQSIHLARQICYQIGKIRLDSIFWLCSAVFPFQSCLRYNMLSNGTLNYLKSETGVKRSWLQ